MRRKLTFLGLVVALIVVCIGVATAKSAKARQNGTWEFTKDLIQVRPETVTYTLHDGHKTQAPKASSPAFPVVEHGAVRRLALDNGLRLLVQEVPYDDVVAIELLVRCGVFQEESNLAGYTNLILEMLLNRIILDNGEDIAEITGSVVDTSVTPDVARISIVTSSRYSQEMLERLCKAIVNPQFSEEELAAVRGKLVLELKERGGSMGQLYEIFLSQFYRYHPYKRSTYGSPLVLEKSTAQSVSEFYARHFSANNIVISISGRVATASIEKIITAKLDSMRPFAEDNLLVVQWEPQAQERDTALSSSASMAIVMVGYPAPPMLSGDYAAMRLACGALGNGLSSRLWVELREKRGLAYELSGEYPELCGPSYFLCHVVCKPTSSGEVRRRILSEIERFKEQGIGEQELEETRNKLIGDYLLARETNAGRALHIGMAELLGSGYAADSRYLEELKRIKAADVRKIACKYFTQPCILTARPGGFLHF